MIKKYFSSPFIIFCFIAYVFLTALIFSLALTDGATSTEQSNSVWDFLAKIFNWGEEFKVFVRKFIGHFLMFLALAFFATIVYYKLSVLTFKKHVFVLSLIITLLIGFITACISELFQLEFFTDDRNASFLDVVIDFLGYLLGYGFCLSLNRIVRYIIYRKGAKQ